MYGYHGRILIVDLTSQQARYEPLGEDVLRAFIGGIGLGTYLLYRFCPPGADPLGPENPLIFVGSPLVGTRLTTSSKFAVLAKSPLTGFIGDSLSSSFMATELKGLGSDAVVLTGFCETPTLLFLDSAPPPSLAGKREEGVGLEGSGDAVNVRFLPAGHLLGLSTFDTEARVKEELGDRRIRVACIGPAGERLVRYASIANDGGRQAGRTGPGAVMGSKNLKAMAVRGRAQTTVHDPGRLDEIGDALTKKSLGPATEKYRVLGTMANVAVFNRLGTLPTRNFQQTTFEGAEHVSGEVLFTEHRVKDAHCANCTIGCEKILITKDAGPETKGRMEYETLFALGPLLGISDPNAIIRAARLCDELGMDTISAGVTIAWAMECAERGIDLAQSIAEHSHSPSPSYAEGLGVRSAGRGGGALPPPSGKGAGGRGQFPSPSYREGLGVRSAGNGEGSSFLPLEGKQREGEVGEVLHFGNTDAVLRALNLIARREGVGDLLAEGTRRASAIVGHGSHAWAMHVKGLEMPGYEPRSLKTMALGLAVSTRGACHNRSSAYEADFSSRVDRLKADEARGAIAMQSEDFESVLDSLIWCKFLRKAFDDFYAESAEVYERVTGWPITPDELRRAGERISTLKKLFNIREGWARADDTLPPRALQEKLSDGVAAGLGLTPEELDLMIASYYRARGWAEDGTVPEAKLRELGLVDVFASFR
ncbi:MAG: hypothetical protein EXR47_01820 [Dehalococcoidia bacterium]|nr:hypothetical protein [Dehalococcoidia bacterium]